MEGAIDWKSMIGKTVAEVATEDNKEWTNPEAKWSAKITFTDGSSVYVSPLHHWSAASIVLADRVMDQ